MQKKLSHALKDFNTLMEEEKIPIIQNMFKDLVESNDSIETIANKLGYQIKNETFLDDVKVALGNILRKCREQKSLYPYSRADTKQSIYTVRGFAELINSSVTTISHIERGKRAPKTRLLSRYKSVLNIDNETSSILDAMMEYINRDIPQRESTLILSFSCFIDKEELVDSDLSSFDKLSIDLEMRIKELLKDEFTMIMRDPVVKLEYQIRTHT